jgi:hypothetical protein
MLSVSDLAVKLFIFFFEFRGGGSLFCAQQSRFQLKTGMISISETSFIIKITTMDVSPVCYCNTSYTSSQIFTSV